MRRAPLVVVVVLFGAWFLLKGVPWLGQAPAATYATPIAQPDSGGELREIPLKAGARACVTGIPYGPDAKYVAINVVTARPAGPLRFEATAPGGYRATTTVPAPITNNQQVLARIPPARRDVSGGTLCVVNAGTRAVGLFGIDPAANPSETRVDDVVQGQDLSVTLLTSPSRSLSSRLGTLFDHAAAFNPTSGWFVWIVFLLLMLGAPVAIGVALGRAAAEDDQADSARR
jgi:hypothetical protein